MYVHRDSAFQMSMYFDLTVDVLDLFEITQSVDSMNKFQLHQFGQVL